MTSTWSSDSESELSLVRSIIGTGAMLEAMVVMLVVVEAIVVVLGLIGWIMRPILWALGFG